MQTVKTVHCYKCDGVILKIDKEKEFRIKTRCGHCGADQTVLGERVFKVVVLPRNEETKLSTGQLLPE